VRHMAWELAQPWSVTLAASLLLGVTLLVWAVHRRHMRALILIVAAAGTLVPGAVVADFFWPGFDRYLFMALILLATACMPVIADVSERLTPALQRSHVSQLALTSLLCWLALSTHATARFFSSDRAFAASMVSERPDDPTGYLLILETTAREQVSPEQRAYLRALAQRPLPPAISQKVALTAYANGMYAEAALCLETAYRGFPGDPWVRFSMLELRGAQHRFDEALELASGLLEDRSLCGSTRAKLLGWLAAPQLPGTVRQRIQGLLVSQPCH